MPFQIVKLFHSYPAPDRMTIVIVSTDSQTHFSGKQQTVTDTDDRLDQSRVVGIILKFHPQVPNMHIYGPAP
jgi:hypothetical protein